MLPVAFLCLFVGQVPPPPVPHPPESYERSTPTDESPSSDDPKAQREWLMAHLTAALQAQGKLNAKKHREIERMVNNVSDSQVDALVEYYEQRKAQVEAEQLSQAEANLHRLEAYRDRLKVEVERRRQVYEQEQAITAYGSALAAQQSQWAMGNFYAAPYYYAPYPHHRRHW